MMPEVSIHYLMAIFRAFLLTIGHKMNVCIIALDKSGIKMKCSDGLKPLCALVHTKTSKPKKVEGPITEIFSSIRLQTLKLQNFKGLASQARQGPCAPAWALAQKP